MSARPTTNNLLFPMLAAFCVASSTLLLQIVETRIYAVVFWNHVVYLIVSIALLGFGISGTWLAFGKQTWMARNLTAPVAAVLFAIFAIVSAVIVPQFDVQLMDIFGSGVHLIRLFATYATAILPYFFAGWILGVIYRDYAERIHLLYFADLSGAAVGCLLVLALLRPLGAVNLVLLACAMVAVPVLAHEALVRGKMLLPLACTLALLAFLSLCSKAIEKRILPDHTKSFFNQYKTMDPRDKRVVEFSEWSILARTDVVGTELPPRKNIFIDGDAFTGMVLNPEDAPIPVDFDKKALIPVMTPYVLPRKFDDVLVIGSGGGPDVWNALCAGAKTVDAVEINPTTARIMKDEYRKASNDLFLRPGVTLYNEEGRSFVRSRSTRYDVVMINAIDTFAALSSGAYMLAENYLYTVEGTIDYVTHLKPEGTLCITRWDYSGETLRLFAVMLEALFQLGYPDPEKHIVALSRNGWTAILVSPKAFSDDEVTLLKARAAKFDGTYYFPLPVDERSTPNQKDLNAYARARHIGAQEAFCEAHFYNVRPVTDDSPFFFHYDKARSLFAVFGKKGFSDFVRGHWASFTLSLLMALMTAALLLFVFLPLTRRRVRMAGFARWLTYFCCLGLAFIFAEICFMQRFALLLGAPARSLALVLAALLLFAGIGSYMKERLAIRIETALLLLAAILLVAAFGYPHIIRGLLGLPLWMRGALTVMLVAPAGFFMGMPFPSGLRIVSARSEDAVPWMWAVNGGATVLGSVLAISLAIRFSFTTVLVMAALGYICALVCHIARAR